MRCQKCHLTRYQSVTVGVKKGGVKGVYYIYPFDTHPPFDTTPIARSWKEVKRVEFFMPMMPPTATHQEKQVRMVKGRPVFYEPEKLKAARAKLTAHLAGHRPEQPMEGGVRLLVKWCFPRGQHKDGEYRITKPDTDNLNKLLKDCMTAAGFWKDDAQVASEICEKFWAEVPGIYIRAEEIGGEVG